MFDVFENINSDYFGLCFDSSHSWLYEKEENEVLKKLSEKLFCVHFSDNDKKEDKHWLKIDGQNNWYNMLKYFPKNEKNVNISLEVFPKDDKNEIIFLEKAYKMANEIRDIIIE